MVQKFSNKDRNPTNLYIIEKRPSTVPSGFEKPLLQQPSYYYNSHYYCNNNN